MQLVEHKALNLVVQSLGGDMWIFSCPLYFILWNLGDTTLELRFRIGKLTQSWQPSFDQVIEQNQNGKRIRKK